MAMNKLMASTRWTLQVKTGGRNANTSKSELKLASHLDGQSPLYGWFDVGERHVGRMECSGATRRFHQRGLAPTAVLYTLFARACDPWLNF
jgi:hypothetical protein